MKVSTMALALTFLAIAWSLIEPYMLQTKAVTVYRMIGLATLEVAVAFLLDHKIDVNSLMTNKIVQAKRNRGRIKKPKYPIKEQSWYTNTNGLGCPRLTNGRERLRKE